MRTKHIAVIVGLALVATAGMAAATYAGMSIWGGNNPGQGSLHAAMPEAAADHNRAGENHPTPGDDEGTGDEGGAAAGAQPDDVPPAHAQDGEPEDGQPDDVPPEHSSADENPPEDAGVPEELPDQANDHADEHFPPDTGAPEGA